MNHLSLIRHVLIALTLTSTLVANTYYVATTGSDTNPGSIETPFQTIQHAVDIMQSGDTCYLRAGSYSEEVQIHDLPHITIQNFPNEEVTLNGTVLIENTWSVYEGQIYKTTLDQDIWQLFVDDEEMIMARWPNARFDDGTIWDQDNNWAHGDENASVNGMEVDDPYGGTDLSSLPFSIEGALAILNIGSFRSYTRYVTSHQQGSNEFEFDLIPDGAYRTKHHYYFLEKKLEFLDQENEWYYDPGTGDLYFWPPDNADPNDLNIHGKDQAYAFQIQNSSHVLLKGIHFFATTIKIDNSDYSTVDGCRFLYPSCYRRMLGVAGAEPEMTRIDGSSHCLITRSSFEYTDGSAIETYGGENIIEDNYFYHIDWTVTDLSSVMTSMRMGGDNNIFRQNTVHRTGASSGLNPGNVALVQYNEMYDTGYLQSDGAIIHFMEGQQIDSETCYNWLHDSPKYGVRYDGDGDGHSGTMHHNVSWNVNAGHMVKGYEHNVYNNTSFNSNNNNIIILIDLGGNEGTITRNNAADEIAGHRWDTYDNYPVPGIYDHNWNGYLETGNLWDFLVDPENYDFRPMAGSPLIDAGVDIPGITDGFTGSAPDLGAYEYGGDHWQAGITWDPPSNPLGIIENDQNNEIPLSFKLEQNFPNPFNGSTSIEFSILRPQLINVSIFNINGQLITELLNGQTESGEYQLNWSPEQTASGVYLIQLRSQSGSQVKKCLLVK